MAAVSTIDMSIVLFLVSLRWQSSWFFAAGLFTHTLTVKDVEISAAEYLVGW